MVAEGDVFQLHFASEFARLRAYAYILRLLSHIGLTVKDIFNALSGRTHLNHGLGHANKLADRGKKGSHEALES